jgi:acyl-CoA reductase-like NAD-dependent aldehyde dehydrogenase
MMLSEAAADGRAVPAFRAVFERQKEYFATDATKPYDWRIDQLNRLTRMLAENEKKLSDASKRDFKTALQEHVFEVAGSIGSIEATKRQLPVWMKPVEAPVPKQTATNEVLLAQWFGLLIDAEVDVSGRMIG